MSRPDVVFVGGGAIGLASAWRLARRGATVTVADPTPGGGASTVAAGMLAPVTEARLGEDDLLRLNLASLGLWPGFAAEVEAASGRPVGYRSDGTLVVALDADDRVALDELVSRQQALGLPVHRVRGREVRRLEPGLAPSVRAGAVAEVERSVDPEALHPALLAAAEAAGVTVVRDRVTRVLTTAGTAEAAGRVGRVTGVALEGGEVVEAPTVVLAAGCWSGQVAGLPEGCRPPVRPVKGQILTLSQAEGEPLVSRTVRGLAHGFSIYLVPRDDGRLVCGATVEERGYDTRVTAGGAYGLVRDVLALFPGLDDAELVTVRSGLRPGTPDDLPLVGPGGLDGLVMATGHHRNGILLTPVTAEAVAAVASGGPVPPEARPCDPRRFAGPPAPSRPGRAETASGAGSTGTTRTMGTTEPAGSARAAGPTGTRAP